MTYAEIVYILSIILYDYQIGINVFESIFFLCIYEILIKILNILTKKVIEMYKEEIIRLIRNNYNFLNTEYSVSRIGIFGSEFIKLS